MSRPLLSGLLGLIAVSVGLVWLALKQSATRRGPRHGQRAVADQHRVPGQQSVGVSVVITRGRV